MSDLLGTLNDTDVIPPHYAPITFTVGDVSMTQFEHLLAEIVRLDRAAHRPVGGDSALAEGIKLAARSHQNLVGERTRHVLRLRSASREFYPAALQAFPELDARDAL